MLRQHPCSSIGAALAESISFICTSVDASFFPTDYFRRLVVTDSPPIIRHALRPGTSSINEDFTLITRLSPIDEILFHSSFLRLDLRSISGVKRYLRPFPCRRAASYSSRARSYIPVHLFLPFPASEKVPRVRDRSMQHNPLASSRTLAETLRDLTSSSNHQGYSSTTSGRNFFHVLGVARRSSNAHTLFPSN